MDIIQKWSGGQLRIFEVDDGDGSGAASRCEVKLKSNGEHGSGGILPRMRRDEVEALIAALQLALPNMKGD